MNRPLKWYNFITLNSYWLGLNISSGTITPVLLPYLVILFMPEELKNTYLANVRVIGLAVAMLVQPIAGMLSDRSQSRFGRRRPFILIGAVFSAIFVMLVGSSIFFVNSPLDGFFQGTLGVTTAYAVLLTGIVLLQVSSNIGHGALQGVIPDVVPENQRGKASGVKAVFELVPVFLVLFIGPLVSKGKVLETAGIVAAGFILTMLITLFFVKETPYQEPASDSLREPIVRLIILTAIFVGATQLAVWLVKTVGNAISSSTLEFATRVGLVGLLGLAAMTAAILVGVYVGAWVGIGRDASQHKGFIWWVVGRLLFLAAVGSVQSFALYFLRDVIRIPDAPRMTTVLLAVVALFLIPSALGGGALADRFGQKRMVIWAGIVAAFGCFLLLFARSMPLVLVSGCIIGLGTGTFMATNWAMGTSLVPSKDAGKYLGISNLAGAGAGIIGVGIGGPMADFMNAVQPGLGYLVLFGIYAALFILSSLTLVIIQRYTVVR